MEEEKLEYNEEKNKRQLFLDEIKLTLEAEYNAPLKPEFVEQVDRKLIKEKFQQCIDKFYLNSDMTYEEIIKYLLDRINEGRRINPNAKGEHDVLEEILYDMLGQEEEIDL